MCSSCFCSEESQERGCGDFEFEQTVYKEIQVGNCVGTSTGIYGGGYSGPIGGGGGSTANTDPLVSYYQNLIFECGNFLGDKDELGFDGALANSNLTFEEASFCSLLTLAADNLVIGTSELQWLQNTHENEETRIKATRIFMYILGNQPLSTIQNNGILEWIRMNQEGEAPELTFLEFMELYVFFHKELKPPLTENEIEELIENHELGLEIKEFFETIEDEEEKEIAKEFIDVAVNMMADDPEIKWERLKELYEVIENDEYALVDCAGNSGPPNAVFFWTDLASFTPSEAVINKLESLDGNWDIQEIENASSNRVNLDYFPIEITNMPFMNGTQMSGDELLSHIRRNINDFVNTNFGEFNPINQNEVNLWQSNNPLTTVISIDIPFQDGSVVCSFYEQCCWIFTTLDAPFFGDGIHPVSGNRQFGWRTNNDGNIEIFTKGADRMAIWPGWLETGLVFSGADALWLSFREKVAEWVNNNGGSANTGVQPTMWRPDWNKVKDLLKSNELITSIPCEN
jgi:hypothetical protein